MSTGEYATEFDGRRRRLFGLAYRLLGSAEEAEDVVQDAFLRWRTADHAGAVVRSVRVRPRTPPRWSRPPSR